jgi:hypothetical protein
MDQRLDEVAIDPQDISWLEQDENMEDAPRVKNVNTRQVRKSRPDISDLEPVGYFNDVSSVAKLL